MSRHNPSNPNCSYYDGSSLLKSSSPDSDFCVCPKKWGVVALTEHGLSVVDKPEPCCDDPDIEGELVQIAPPRCLTCGTVYEEAKPTPNVDSEETHTEQWRERRMSDPEFRMQYEAAKAEIDRIDAYAQQVERITTERIERHVRITFDDLESCGQAVSDKAAFAILRAIRGERGIEDD